MEQTTLYPTPRASAALCTWVWQRLCFHALTCLNRVVLFPIIVCIKKPLKPLKELKVVLKLPFHQSLHRDDLLGESNL